MSAAKGAESASRDVETSLKDPGRRSDTSTGDSNPEKDAVVYVCVCMYVYSLFAQVHACIAVFMYGYVNVPVYVYVLKVTCVNIR